MIELSELQLSLLLAGFFIIFSIWLVNRIQLGRIHRQQNKLTSPPPLSQQRYEPTLHYQADEIETNEPAFTSAVEIKAGQDLSEHTHSTQDISDEPESVAKDTVPDTHDSNPVIEHIDQQIIVSQPKIHKNWQPSLPNPNTLEPIIDPKIDCVIELPLEYPLSSERILPLLKHFRHVGTRTVHCEGLNIALQKRELIRAGQGYRDLCVAVQLVNRHGAITALELSEFTSGAQKIAQHLEISMTPPDITAVLDRAQKLDAFAQQSDVQLCLQIQAPQQPWSVSQLKKIFEQDGLSLARDGICFNYYPEMNTSVPTFTASLGQINFLDDDIEHATDSKINIYFNATHIPQGIQAFRLTWSYAQHLATTLSGKIIDDLGRPLSDKAVQMIEQHLCELYAQLNRYGIPAGSGSALRLFSD